MSSFSDQGIHSEFATDNDDWPASGDEEAHHHLSHLTVDDTKRFTALYGFGGGCNGSALGFWIPFCA